MQSLPCRWKPFGPLCLHRLSDTASHPEPILVTPLIYPANPPNQYLWDTKGQFTMVNPPKRKQGEDVEALHNHQRWNWTWVMTLWYSVCVGFTHSLISCERLGFTHSLLKVRIILYLSFSGTMLLMESFCLWLCWRLIVCLQVSGGWEWVRDSFSPCDAMPVWD